MHSLKSRLVMMGAAMALSVLGGSAAMADAVLPTADCGLGATNNCLTFGDFDVYSLALLNFQAGSGAISPGDPFYVKSNGSDIANDIVIGSSDANAINNQDLASIAGKVDNAYNTPNDVGGGLITTNFLMLAPDPTASFTGDNAAQAQTTIADHNAPNTGATGTVANGSLPLWDIQTAALKNYLAGQKMVFYFNLNQTNSATSYLNSPQDMLASMDVIFTCTNAAGCNGNPLGSQVKYRLNGDSCGGGPGSCVPGAQSWAQTAGVDDILSSPTDAWAYVHGQVCVNDSGAVLQFGACSGLNSFGHTINQNLGANTAAFALYSQSVQDALTSGFYDVMSVDLRMAAEDNGFEQLFIKGTTFSAPEPSSIAIAGAGLALMGLGFAWRRRRATAGAAKLAA